MLSILVIKNFNERQIHKRKNKHQAQFDLFYQEENEGISGIYPSNFHNFLPLSAFSVN